MVKHQVKQFDSNDTPIFPKELALEEGVNEGDVESLREALAGVIELKQQAEDVFDEFTAELNSYMPSSDTLIDLVEEYMDVNHLASMCSRRAVMFNANTRYMPETPTMGDGRRVAVYIFDTYSMINDSARSLIHGN